MGISRVITGLPFLSGNVIIQDSNIGMVTPPSQQDLLKSPMIRVVDHSQSLFPQVKLPVETMTPIPATPALNSGPVLRFQENIVFNRIVLCVTFHHMAMDGLGVMNVMKEVARNCRDLASQEATGFATTPGREAQIREIENHTAAEPGKRLEGYCPQFWSHSELTSRAFAFPAQKIRSLCHICNTVVSENALRERVQDSYGDHKDNFTCQPAKLSSNDVFTALLWLCGSRARYRSFTPSKQFAESSGPTSTRLSMAVNVRQIIQPPIPQAYIGNATVVASYTHPRKMMVDSISMNGVPAQQIKNDELLALTKIALKIRHGIRYIDDQHVRRVISHIKDSEDRRFSSFYFPDMFITNLRMFDLYAWDFGSNLGQVVDVDQANPRVNGLCVIKPVRGLSGSQFPRQQTAWKQSPWKIRWVLEQQSMEELQKDTLFCWALGYPTCHL